MPQKILCWEDKKTHYTMGEIFAKHISYGRLVSRIYQKILKFNNKNKSNYTIGKRETHRLHNNHIKRCLISLGIVEIQIKSTMKYHYTKWLK